ncbi:MAG: hypothetical protein ACRD0Q_10745 [Acidimicrobiales bacterium]
MPALVIVPLTLVLLTLVLLSALLAGLAWYEDRLLSPRSLILYCARCRGTLPDHAENVVTAESARLLAKMAPQALAPQPAEAARP